jgi:hypothetical protein
VQREPTGLRGTAMIALLLTSGIALAGSVCSVNSFCPARGPTAIR